MSVGKDKWTSSSVLSAKEFAATFLKISAKKGISVSSATKKIKAGVPNTRLNFAKIIWIEAPASTKISVPMLTAKNN